MRPQNGSGPLGWGAPEGPENARGGGGGGCPKVGRRYDDEMSTVSITMSFSRFTIPCVSPPGQGAGAGQGERMLYTYDYKHPRLILQYLVGLAWYYLLSSYFALWHNYGALAWPGACGRLFYSYGCVPVRVLVRKLRLEHTLSVSRTRHPPLSRCMSAGAASFRGGPDVPAAPRGKPRASFWTARRGKPAGRLRRFRRRRVPSRLRLGAGARSHRPGRVEGARTEKA